MELIAAQYRGRARVLQAKLFVLYIQDVVVEPNYQGMGIGIKIMECLMAYIEKVAMSACNTMVGLMSAKGKERFYEKFGFQKRPNEFQGNGMILRISK